jgi:outer membrane receptor protein involved in Fe transport
MRAFLTGLLSCIFTHIHAQTTISGNISDRNNEALIGANITLKGTSSGTVTDLNGNFVLVVQRTPPFTLVISYIGYQNKELEISKSESGLKIILEEESSLLNEVVVSASRVEEKILESPVTIEKLDLQTIKTSASPDFFDQMVKLKGVTTASGSMNFNAINTRGFGGVSNVRFVQLVDGVDNSAPLLNFPVGNLVGLTETDIRSIELVPGAASALYGPNAFNGIMILASKSPFDYQGLSLSGKLGFTNARNDGANPLYQLDMRYAKAWKKFGFKVTAGYFGATDWLANDYNTDVNTQINYFGRKPANFDGTNTYGDEAQILIPFSPDIVELLASSELAEGLAEVFFNNNVEAARDYLRANIPKLNPVDIRRTGFTEQELLDNRNATSLKTGTSIHYKPTEDIEINGSFKLGSGNSIYQGNERYALRNFITYNAKLEATGKNFMTRAYMTQTKAGDSYNLTALGLLTNETLLGTESDWAPNYLGNYIAVIAANALLFNREVDQLSPGLYKEAHAAGRREADLLIDRSRMQDVIRQVRSGLFQQGGAGFIDDSRLWHAEGTYDFTSLMKDKFGILIGGNYRLYDLFTNGTVFNEDPEGTGINKRIRIGEYGAFIQATKKLFQEKLRISASIRYDKNENFKGQFTPRVASVLTLGKQRQHNFRTSFQTGFRNPDTQAQFLYFPATSILLGGARANAERYGIYEGGAYSLDSYNAYLNSVLQGNPNPDLLEVFYMDYIQPEKLTSIELGYKGFIKGLFLDWNVYHNWYRDFIGSISVVNIEKTTHKGEVLPGVNQVLAGEATAPTVFRPSFNVNQRITSWGTAIGLSFKLPKGNLIKANYNYMDFDTEEAAKKAVEFNSPNHMFNIGLANSNVRNSNIGFDISYRWQSAFFFVTSFGNGNIKAYGTLDAAVIYTHKKWNTNFKMGVTNLLGPDYRNIIGGPFIGRTFFTGFTYEPGDLGRKKKA